MNENWANVVAIKILEVSAALRLRSLWRPVYWGFADQAVISASNFLMMLLLARNLGPALYGTFVLAYTVLLFTNSIQSALFTQPHNVLGAARTGEDYRAYTTVTFISQITFSIIAGVLIALAASLLMLAGRSYGPLLLAVAAATVTWQIQEFCRRVFYTQGDYLMAFANDLFTYGGQVIGLLFLWKVGQLTASLAVLVVAVASALGAIVGILRIWTNLDWTLSRVKSFAIIGENWQFGKWLFGSAMASWISGQLYPVLTAGFVGVAATGGLRATQNLVAPTHIIVKTFEAVSPPRAARAYRHGGLAALRAELLRFGRPLGALLLLYFTGVSILADIIVPWLMGEQYRPYAWLVWVFSITYLLGYGSLMLSVSLRSIGKTAPMFAANMMAAIFALTAGIWLVRTWGLEGAAVGMAVNSLILFGVLGGALLFFARSRQQAGMSDT